MFEKLKQNEEARSQVIGAVLLLVVVALSYAAGRGDGRESEREQMSDAQRLEAKIDRVIAKFESSRECSNVVASAIRDDADQSK